MSYSGQNHCLRFPPSLNSYRGVTTMDGFAFCDANWWCGEYVRDATKALDGLSDQCGNCQFYHPNTVVA